MEDSRNHPAVCAAEAEAFQRSADNSSAEKAETQEFPETLRRFLKEPHTTGVDVPGVGHVHAEEKTSPLEGDAGKSDDLSRLMSLYSELVEMGHAGVDLAMSNIVWCKAARGSFCRDVTECRECGAISDASGAVTHNPRCRTGLVLSRACHFNASAHRDFAPALPGFPEVGEDAAKLKVTTNSASTPGSFGEPWTIVGSDAARQKVYIGSGSGIAGQVFELNGSWPTALDAAHRLVNCVNSSVGISDAVLLKATGAEHFLVRITDRARFTNFAAAWASIEDAPFEPKGGVQ